MKVVNPYKGVDFNNTVKSITHEHIHGASQWSNAYNRGIRHFAAMSYQPASPRFPASNYLYKIVDGTPVLQTYQDYADLPNKDYTVVEKTLKGSVVEFTDAEGNVIKTDDLPQVPNNEHPTFTRQIGSTTSFLNHFNVLGSMWCEAGWGLSNGNTSDRTGHPLCDLSDMAEFLKSDNQYFANGKMFATINHCSSVDSAKTLIKSDFGKMPLGFEVFNQGYSRDFNKKCRNCYDALLSEGYKINAVAVIDWQGYIEKDLLPEGYVPEADYDRGCNVLLVEPDYDSLPANDFIEVNGKKYPNYHSNVYTKAEAGMDCYISGRFYASGLGNHKIVDLSENNGIITFKVDGSPTSLEVITNKGAVKATGNTLNYTIQKGVSYVRFEAFYDNDEKKDFIMTNPIWIEDNAEEYESGGLDKRKRILLMFG